jgi:hypothetical protein
MDTEGQTTTTEVEDTGTVTDTGADNGGAEAGNNEDTGADSPYADLAQKIGWVPRDQFTGPPEAWKPADQFIIDGRDIQRETSARLKGVEAKLDTLTKTSASIAEQTINERVEALRTQHTEAVEAGDADQALKIARTIDTTLAATPANNGPSPEAQAFAERNSSWFNKPGFEYETSRAFEICRTLAAQGYTDHTTQLRIAEQRLRQENPKLFKDNLNGTRKDPPGVNAPGSRGAAPTNRQKGFADMPKEAQDIARDMVERKVIKSTDDYTRNYFANLQGKA